MNYYKHLRNLLFSLDAETAHGLSLSMLNDFNFLMTKKEFNHNPINIMGINFNNRVGLAAGLDKNAEYLDALGKMGFGFIEVGTVTPRPQEGNPKPRLFRLPDANAIINRMGFNNGGVENLLNNLKKSNYDGIIGINIGKNFDTPIENATHDYLTCLRAVYPFADYVTINISSPNTKNLRQLQDSNELEQLLDALKLEQQMLAKQYNSYIPLVLKIAPDLSEDQIKVIAQTLLKYEIDGVIATNTTLSRIGVEHLPHAKEAGGLSGIPVREKSLSVIKQLYAELGDKIPIIGVGGIFSVTDAQEKIRAGAKLIQIYSGFIYEGPELIEKLAYNI